MNPNCIPNSIQNVLAKEFENCTLSEQVFREAVALHMSETAQYPQDTYDYAQIQENAWEIFDKRAEEIKIDFDDSFEEGTVDDEIEYHSDQLDEHLWELKDELTRNEMVLTGDTEGLKRLAD